MTAVELLAPHEATPANEKWHELRRQGISASEIAAVLGLSPWDSAFSLYWRKVNGWGVEETPEMVAGRYAEPVIAEWFADACDPHENLAVERAGLYASAERPWELATPDRLIHEACGDCGGRGGGGPASGPETSGLCASCLASGLGSPPLALLECKYVVHGWDGWGEPGTDDVPVWYRAQCLQQLDVMEVDEVSLAAWHGAEFRLYTVRRDEKDLRVMRAAGRDFMDRLTAGDPPPIDGSAATVRTLKALHPSIEDREVQAPVEFAEAYRRARALKARLEKTLDRYEARAREMLGNGNRLTANGHLLCSRSIFDVAESVRAAYTVDKLNPGRAASYLTPKKGRV